MEVLKAYEENPKKNSNLKKSRPLTLGFFSTYFISEIAVSLAFSVSAFYFICWISGRTELQKIAGEGMKFNTTLCILISSFVITLIILNERLIKGKKIFLLAQLASGAVLCLTIVTFSQYISGIDFKIDELLFSEVPKSAPTLYPGRMSPITALGIFLLALGLITFRWKPVRQAYLYQLCLLLVMGIGGFALVGYLFGTNTFYQVGPYVRISWQSALCLILLSTSMFCLAPKDGLMKVITSLKPGGFAARRLMLPAVLVPVLIGFLCLRGQLAGMYSINQGWAFSTISYIIIFAFLTYRISRSINENDLGRTQINERLRSAMEAAAVGTWRIDLKTGITNRDASFNRILGLEFEDVTSTLENFIVFIHPHDRTRVELAISKAISNLDFYNEEFRIIRPDGSIRWINDRGQPVEDENGEYRYMAGASVDVTELKQAEQDRLALAKNVEARAIQLQKMSKAFMTVVSSSSLEQLLQVISDEARAIIGADRAVTSASTEPAGDQNWFEVLNVSSFFEKNKKWDELDENTDFTAVLNYVCRGKKPVRLDGAQVKSMSLWKDFTNAEKRFIPKAGWLAVPLIGNDGMSMGLIQLFDKSEGDFTAEDEFILVQLAQMAAIAIQNSRLLISEQHAVRARDEFLSIASHELKTPLTSLKLQTQIQKRKVEKNESDAYSPERILRLVNVSDKQIDRLSRLVDDMLDLGRIKSGKLSLHIEEFDMRDLIKEVLERLNPQLEAAKCKLTSNIPESIVGTWDRFRIEQVILNVLTNAIKYGEGSNIEISAVKNRGKAVLSIKDHGQGIAPENIEKIFQRFQQVGTSNVMSGLGLGLYIVKHIVNMHHGSVRVESSMGQGSNFIIELPIISTALVEPRPAPSSPEL